MAEKIEKGDRVRVKIDGREGTVISTLVGTGVRGTIQVRFQIEQEHNGRTLHAEYVEGFSEGRLERIDRQVAEEGAA